MVADNREPYVAPGRTLWAARVIVVLGVVQAASMVHFLFYNLGDSLTERGISLREVGVTKAELLAFNADLVHYISHLHIAIAGYGIATGFVVAMLAWFGIRRRVRWAWWAAVGTIVISAGVGLPAHFVYDLATVGHLAPPFILLALFAIAAAISYPHAGEGTIEDE